MTRPNELRNKVTSPNGTTQAAIESLQSDDLASMFERAMQACVSRSEAISQELANSWFDQRFIELKVSP